MQNGFQPYQLLRQISKSFVWPQLPNRIASIWCCTHNAALCKWHAEISEMQR
jgi:hypothetical protein